MRAARHLAAGGAREGKRAHGGAVVVVQGVWRYGDTRERGGEVTGGDQELAAPSGTSQSMLWPCRHRHQDDSLILGPKKKK